MSHPIQPLQKISPAENETTPIFKNIEITQTSQKPEPKSTPPATSHDQEGGSTKKNPKDEEWLFNLIQADINSIKEKYRETFTPKLDQAPDAKHFRNKYLYKLREAVLKLKDQIHTHEKHLYGKSLSSSFTSSQSPHSTIPDDLLKLMPNFHEEDGAAARAFKNSTEFHDFMVRYNKLSKKELQPCLLCFSVFPENSIVKKRLMVQWWVAEGFAGDEDGANQSFLTLIEKGFIQPVNENQSLSIRYCRIDPFSRSALVTIAGAIKFFNFDGNGNPTEKFSDSFRACLVGNPLNDKKLEKIHLVFNVSERNLDIEPKLFSRMRNVRILFLGRWELFQSDHPVFYETEDLNTIFLDKSVNMKYLKLLSLHGVSNIKALDDSSLSKLISLEYLDLRNCYDLLTIPKEIRFLSSLTHLDISECMCLSNIPKELSQLKKLRVLKGFIVSVAKNVCTLDDLSKGLEHLIKLGIFTTLGEFPNSDHLSELREMKDLRKLTITWSATRREYEIPSDDGGGHEMMMKLPSKLEKLDLRRFQSSPNSRAPTWLRPSNFEHGALKKLYIRAGNFADLGQYQDVDDGDWNLVNKKKKTWRKVGELRLRYLSKLEMEWGQIQELFPDLDYLEYINCPKLSLFPCYANDSQGEVNRMDQDNVSFSWKKKQT